VSLAGAADSVISAGSMRGLEIAIPADDGRIEGTLVADRVAWLEGGKLQMASGTVHLYADENGQDVTLEFEEAVYDINADRLVGEGLVDVTSADGNAQAIGFTAYFDERRLEFHESVTAETPEYRLSGDSGEIWYARGEDGSDPVITRIDVRGNVSVELREPPSSGEFDFVRVNSGEVQADRIARELRILTLATGWTVEGVAIPVKLREDQPYLHYPIPVE